MSAMNIEQARFNMIEQQIRPWDVLDDRVLQVISGTPREEFVPERYRALAFSDISIPLEHGEVMMPPKLEGKLLQSLTLQPADSVLEIGTGSGYQAAVLSPLVRDVYSIEIVESLPKNALQKVLKRVLRTGEILKQKAPPR